MDLDEAYHREFDNHGFCDVCDILDDVVGWDGTEPCHGQCDGGCWQAPRATQATRAASMAEEALVSGRNLPHDEYEEYEYGGADEPEVDEDAEEDAEFKKYLEYLEEKRRST